MGGRACRPIPRDAGFGGSFGVPPRPGVLSGRRCERALLFGVGARRPGQIRQEGRESHSLRRPAAGGERRPCLGACGSLVCDLAVQRLREITRQQQRAFLRPCRTENVRLHPCWLRNQLSVQEILRGRTDIRIAQPQFAFPLARFLRRLPTNDCVLYGARMQDLGTTTAASVAVCLWSGAWAPSLAAEVLQRVQEMKAAATDAARPHGESCGEVVEAERPARHGESCGSSGSSAPVARTGGEGSASGEDALLIQVVRILHQQGFDLFSQAGADLILAHRCVAAAIGFAIACNAGALANLGFSAPALAYGFVCAGAKAHWPQDTLANGLASLKHLRARWGASLAIPDAQRSRVRFECERVSFVGGFVP